MNFFTFALITAIFASDAFKPSRPSQLKEIRDGSNNLAAEGINLISTSEEVKPSENPSTKGRSAEWFDASSIPIPSSDSDLTQSSPDANPSRDQHDVDSIAGPDNEISGHEKGAPQTNFFSMTGELLFTVESDLNDDEFAVVLRNYLEEKNYSQDTTKLIVEGVPIDTGIFSQESIAIIRASNAPINIVRIFRSVRKICIRSGDLIDEIKFVMDDGTEKTYGEDGNLGRGPGGDPQTEFCLDDGELLTIIQRCEGNLLDAIRFGTDKGRYSDWYGNRRGGEEKEEVRAPLNQMIVGLQRESGYCQVIQNVLFEQTRNEQEDA